MKEMKNSGKFSHQHWSDEQNKQQQCEGAQARVKRKSTLTKTLITLDVTSLPRQYQFVKWWVLLVGVFTNYIETT